MRWIRPLIVPLAHVKSGLNRILALLLDHEIVKINKGIIKPWDNDALFQKVWVEVTKETSTITGMPKMTRAYVLKDLLLANAPLRENVAECGVYQGATAIILASYLKEYELLKPDKRLLLFDSFEGLSEPDPNLDGDFFRKGDFAADLHSIQKKLERFDFVEFWKGWIPERFEENSGRRFSFVHVDVDLYQPIKDCLEFFYPRLLERGMIVFDDYGLALCPGARKAVDEYLEARNTIAIWLPSGQGLVIKREQG